MHSFSGAARLARVLGFVSAVALATTAVAQSAADQGDPTDAPPPTMDTGLNIPSDVKLFGDVDPNVRKPTAIVNGTVITGTDVDQRVALIEAANNLNLSGEDLNRLKLQILRGLIDETLEVQEAKANDVKVTPEEIKTGFNRVAKNFNKTPAEMNQYLRQIGSSPRSLNLQIEAELAWGRYLRRNVAPFINVGDQEVQAILDRLKASKGTEEYHLKEIYLSANDSNAQQIAQSMQAMMKGIQSNEHPFQYYAQFSQASTRAVGGDLGWIQLSTLPASLASAVQQMQPGQVAGPVQVPGGFSILYLVDQRQVLTADPRDAKLSLRQLTIHFPKGISKTDAEARAQTFATETQQIHGCGDVDAVARKINAEVVDNDSITVRQLPAQLQDIMLKMQVGQATPPFGSVTEGVRSLVLCGRDDPQGGNLPRPDQVQDQLQEQRVNLRADQMLRDLRRDAIIEYR